MKTKLIKYFILFILIVNCTNKKNNYTKINKPTKQDNCQIISKSIDSVAAYISPISLYPVGFKLSKEDSLEMKEGTLKYINEFRTIGIDTASYVRMPSYDTLIKMVKNDNFLGFYQLSDMVDKPFPIDINCIKLKKATKINYFDFDSICYYNPKEHLPKFRSGLYHKIDYRFNFSRIVYNHSFDKAVILCVFRFQDKHGRDLIFHFEKTKHDWKITYATDYFGYIN
ncbi:MAG: hypothetical protein ACK5MZ_08405 [Aestuariibaculum sp.]